MSGPVAFLTSFTQALATMALYRVGHPARERAIDSAYSALLDLQSDDPHLLFTFIGEDVVCGQRPVRELRGWDWASRLSEAGIQRLEFGPDVTREDFEGFLDEASLRLLANPGSAQLRQMRQSAIRFGTVGVKGEQDETATPTAVADVSLRTEAEAVRWLHDQLQDEHRLRIAEAEAVVRSLTVAMRSDRELFVPLLRLREFDEYTTTHALNVSVLSMAFAEFLGLPAPDVRAFGIAGLLHDIGKVNIPIEVLTKPGRLTDEERELMNLHPVDGAKLIITGHDPLNLAAVVAYEHHIMIDGGGYPSLRFPRDCHFASKLVHVCDVYDALRTKRPYRDAWPAKKVMDYIAERAGSEFDNELATAFVGLMQAWGDRVVHVDDVPREAVAARAQGPKGEEG